VRSRSRTSSTRATHVEAPYATPTCSSRVRASLFPLVAPQSVPRTRLGLVWRTVTASETHNAVIQADGTPDAPREHARGTPRGVPTISTCIRVTPTTSRVRFWAARVSACGSLVDRLSILISFFFDASCALAGHAQHARRARAGLHPPGFRHASVSLTQYALHLYHSRSVAAGVDGRHLRTRHSVKFLAPRADELDRWCKSERSMR